MRTSAAVEGNKRKEGWRRKIRVKFFFVMCQKETEKLEQERLLHLFFVSKLTDIRISCIEYVIKSCVSVLHNSGIK